MPARGEFHAELTRVDFDRLLMQRVVEKLPRVLNVATHSKRAAIMFATDQSQPTIHVNGSALSQHGRSTSDSGSPYREADTAGQCQCTKSLRSSPLRGARGEKPVAS